MFIINEEIIIENEGIKSEKFIISSKPHQKLAEGFPLDSLSKEIESGKYYYDLEKIKYSKESSNEYRNIFKDAIGKIDKQKTPIHFYTK